MATNPEKIKEIFEEYLDKIGVKNADIRVWNKEDLAENNYDNSNTISVKNAYIFPHKSLSTSHINRSYNPIMTDV